MVSLSLHLLLLVVGCRSDAKPPGMLVDDEGSPLRVGYVEHLTGGAEEGAELPLIVVLHGLGDVPESMIRVLGDYPEPARIVSLRAPDAHHNGWSWFPIGGIGDDVRAPGPVVLQRAETVADFITAYAGEHPTDGEPVITGFSQGGMMSFAVAVHHPDVVGHAVSVGGLLPKPLWPEEAAPAGAPTITALHGEADEIVPLAQATASIEALRSKGWTVQTKTFPGVNHAIPEPVRDAWYATLAEATP